MQGARLAEHASLLFRYRGECRSSVWQREGKRTWADLSFLSQVTVKNRVDHSMATPAPNDRDKSIKVLQPSDHNHAPSHGGLLTATLLASYTVTPRLYGFDGRPWRAPLPVCLAQPHLAALDRLPGYTLAAIAGPTLLRHWPLFQYKRPESA